MGIPAYAASLLLGVISLQFFTYLPDRLWLGLLPFSLLLPVFQPVLRLAILYCCGFLLALLHAQLYVANVLPEELAGNDFLVQGIVSDIPDYDGRVQRFEFDVAVYVPQSQTNMPKHLRVSWYNSRHRVRAGEVWQLRLRLKPPHGSINPGGFDYERWLYQQGIQATGYVRSEGDIQRLRSQESISIDGIRQWLFDHLTSEDTASGMLAALAVGYKGAIAPADWDILRRTGTNHLMAISGLHIGLVAAMAFWLMRRLTPGFIARRIAIPRFAAIIALIAALFYALLAGFAIPTQRALVMLFVVLGAVIMGRQIRPLNSLSLALIAVLVIDPVAVLSPGFWFSFIAVAVIAYGFHGRLGRGHQLLQWGRLQWSIALFLFPLTLFMFQQSSVVAPLANLILVPWVSFLVVPVVLLAMVLAWPFPMLSDMLMQLAGFSINLIWPVMSYLAELPIASWQQQTPDVIPLMLALCGAALLLAPKGIPLRWVGVIMMLPALTMTSQRPQPGDYAMSLLDVGQGLSVFVQTHEHQLIFDTGARLDDDFDLGDRVVVPFLRQKGIHRLDKLIVSHGDNDHIGGATSIIRQLPVTELMGQDIDELDHDNKLACVSGQHWLWDGVVFEILHPDRHYRQRNNNACVLRISTAGGSVLIASDIEKPIEQHIQQLQDEKLHADILIVPHHGSKTSSSAEWLAGISPRFALISAGYRNRFGHPHPTVLERYRAINARILNTSEYGAISFEIQQGKGVSAPKLQRELDRHYWNHPLR